MAGVHGTDYYGKTEHVRGLFYVSTMFYHLNYLPFFPTQSFLFWEIPELKDQYQGIQLPLHWKSVLLGYARGWFGALAIGIYFMGLMSVTDIVAGGLKDFFWAGFIASVAVALIIRHALLSESWDYWVALATLLLISAGGIGYCYLLAARAGAMPAQMEKNLAGLWCLAFAVVPLFAHGVTNFWTPADLDDALVYGAQLGLTDDAVKRRLMGHDLEPFPPLQPSDFRTEAIVAAGQGPNQPGSIVI